MAGSGLQIRKAFAAGIPRIICREFTNSEKKRGGIRKKVKDFWEKTVVLTIPANGPRSAQNCEARQRTVKFEPRITPVPFPRLISWKIDDQPHLEFLCRTCRTP
jgi:hypothetical protein